MLSGCLPVARYFRIHLDQHAVSGLSLATVACAQRATKPRPAKSVELPVTLPPIAPALASAMARMAPAKLLGRSLAGQTHDERWRALTRFWRERSRLEGIGVCSRFAESFPVNSREKEVSSHPAIAEPPP